MYMKQGIFIKALDNKCNYIRISVDLHISLEMKKNYFFEGKHIYVKHMRQ